MEFEQWYNSLPHFTRHYMLGCLATSLALTFKILSVDKIILTYEGLFENYYIWTILTNFMFIGALSFQLLMKLYLIYYAVGSIEKYHTPNNYPDFVYLLLSCAGIVAVYSIVIGQYYTMSNQFLLCLLYIYCKKEPLHKVRFMFGFVFQNAYLPWVILVYELLTGQPVTSLLVGIAAGHTYVVLKDVLPNSQYKLDLLKTPAFVKKLVAQYGPVFTPATFGGFGANNAGAQPAPRANQFNFFGGRGVRLG